MTRISVLDLTAAEEQAVDRVVHSLDAIDAILGHLSVKGRSTLALAIVRQMPGLIGDERAHLLLYFGDAS